MGSHRSLRKNAQCPLFFFFKERRHTARSGQTSSSMANMLLFPPLSLIVPVLLRVRKQPRTGRLWMAKLVQLLHSQPWPLVLCKDLVSDLSPTSRVTGSLGLAREDISVSDSCTTASWESQHTFIQFYHLDCAFIGTLSP